MARESWDQLRLMALEKIADARLSHEKIVDAIELARMAMTVDDLREGALMTPFLLVLDRSGTPAAVRDR